MAAGAAIPARLMAPAGAAFGLAFGESVSLRSAVRFTFQWCPARRNGLRRLAGGRESPDPLCPSGNGGATGTLRAAALP